MNSRPKSALKSISLALIFSLLCEQIAFANPELKPIEWPFRERPEIHFQFPASVARVEDAWVAPRARHDDKLFILIQDAHTNESGQINLAKALDIILQNEKGIRQIFVEAGNGNDSLSFLRKYGTAKQRREIAMRYLRQGTLHGEELLDLTSDREFNLWGVENPELYLKAVEAYRYTARERGKFEVYLSQIENTVKTLKPRVYNPLLLEFDVKRERFLKGETGFPEYIEMLTEYGDLSSSPFEHLKALKRLKSLESKIDFKKASEEQAAAISSLSEADQKEILELAKGLKLPEKLAADDRNGQKAFYALLEEKLEVRSEKLEDRKKYKELFKYISYLHAASKIDPAKIIDEQAALENAVYDSLTRTTDEVVLRRSDRILHSLKKLFDFTLTPEEFEAYKKDSENFTITSGSTTLTTSLTGFLNKQIMDLGQYYERALFLKSGFDAIVARAEEFYALTRARDEAFVENALKKLEVRSEKLEGEQKAVLITGGYHTPNLKSILRRKNISYISVQPQVLHETNHRRYEKLRLDQKFSAHFLGAVAVGSPAATARIVPVMDGLTGARLAGEV
ncbi:MAG: hypothetical protein HYZ52_03645, partial [Candidatus Omnitrophica bacterium]|nr:hypothetical protein [Candidatus Omnitrophota bacterium]